MLVFRPVYFVHMRHNLLHIIGNCGLHVIAASIYGSRVVPWKGARVRGLRLLPAKEDKTLGAGGEDY